MSFPKDTLTYRFFVMIIVFLRVGYRFVGNYRFMSFLLFSPVFFSFLLPRSELLLLGFILRFLSEKPLFRTISTAINLCRIGGDERKV